VRNGGFGSQPKFPHSSALDLLVDIGQRPAGTTQVKMSGTPVSVQEAARKIAISTLEKMARGGMYDHLAGGFHRYSVDEHWVVPHFEKMAYDNSELLKNYVHAYQAFGHDEFARIARDIVRWMDEWLTDREQGGFYASQDADYSLDDDGDYFTWTRDEAAEVLTPEELRIAADYYDIGEIGDMHHNVAKNVLHVKHAIEVVARKNGVPATTASALLQSAKTKLYAARLKRPAPYVDRTIYVSWNGMCISAYLIAGRVLGDDGARAFALKSLDRLLHQAFQAGVLTHVVAYGERADATQQIPAVLDDYVFLGTACLDAWDATGELRYYDSARLLADLVVDRFYDDETGGFFDTAKPGEGERRLGALTARRKPLQDSPTPAGNPMAGGLLLRMAELSGNPSYAAKARTTLETFAAVVEHFGLYAATYASVLLQYLEGPMQVCIVGDDASARELEQIALRGYAINKTVTRIPRIEKGKLPPALDATLPALPPLSGSFAVVCSGGACQRPVESADELAAGLHQAAGGNAPGQDATA